MPVKPQCINPTQMHDLLMQLKYCDAVKRLTKGVTHEYNNVFMGLSGQLSIAMHEEDASKTSPKRKELIKGLLLRGTEQTNLLFDFSRESVESKSLSLANIHPKVICPKNTSHHIRLNTKQQGRL